MAWYSSASLSLMQASPSRSTLKAMPRSHSLRSFGTADSASVPAMNFSIQVQKSVEPARPALTASAAFWRPATRVV